MKTSFTNYICPWCDAVVSDRGVCPSCGGGMIRVAKKAILSDKIEYVTIRYMGA